MNQKYRPLHTLTTGFVLLLLASAVLITSITFYWRLAERIETDVKGRLVALAGDVATELQQALNNRIADVRFVATLPALRRDDLHEERQRIFDHLKGHDPDYAWVGMTATDGTITEASGGLLVGKSVAGRDWFEEGRKALFIGDVHEAILLGKLLPPAADGKMLRLLDIAIPVFGANNALRGVLCAHLDAGLVHIAADRFLERRGRERQYEIIVVSRNNKVLYGPKELEGKTLDPALLVGTGISRWEDGREYLTATAATQLDPDYGGLGWRILARQAHEVAYADLNHDLWYIATASLFAFFIFAWLGLRGVSWCLAPLQAIIDQADRFRSSKNELFQLPESERYEEVARLTASLNRLFRQIFESRQEKEELLATLEQQVEERTADLSHTQALLIDAVECIRDAFCLYDEHDCVIMCNSHYRALVPAASIGTAYTEVHRAAVGKTLTPLDPSESLKNFSARRYAYRNNPEGVFVGRAKNRLVQIVDRRTSVGGTVSLIRDITEDYEREQALLAAKAAADEANTAKSEFLSRMSHELRTPLNAILGYAQVLQIDRREPLGKRQTESIGYIRAAGEHLLQLINEVLDLARIESGRVEMSMQALDPREVVEDCLTLVNEGAEQKGIVLDVDRSQTLPAVCADSLRLKQVLLNILSNAVKYNGRGRRIMVRYAIDGDYFRISVIDNGSGIPASKLQDLFLPFNRLGAEHTSIEGTGIGLSISKKLTEMMGGSIGHAETPGGGATFWIELRLAEQPGRARLPATVEPENDDPILTQDGKGVVVYIEDNGANIALMQSVFELMPEVSLVTFRSAEDGLPCIPGLAPQLILMDINLPGMNGFEALALLRQAPETRNIPVIAVSAAATQNDRARGLDAGFIEYLPKPFNVSRVLKTIHKILNHENQEQGPQG